MDSKIRNISEEVDREAVPLYRSMNNTILSVNNDLTSTADSIQVETAGANGFVSDARTQITQTHSQVQSVTDYIKTYAPIRRWVYLAIFLIPILAAAGAVLAIACKSPRGFNV
jgi:hypothetical protein